LFNFRKIVSKLNSSVWYNKVEAIEELLSNLIDLPLEDLQSIYQNEKAFVKIIDIFIAMIDKETTIKVIEISMDFIEFLLS